MDETGDTTEPGTETEQERDWSCSAYGPGVPALCFFEQASSVCADLAECTARMGDERKRVFRRMQELAAHGDPVWADLADEFTSPEDLLDASPDERPEG